MSLLCRKIKIIQFITKIVEEPACVDPVDEGVIEEESDGDRCFDLLRDPATRPSSRARYFSVLYPPQQKLGLEKLPPG